MKSAIIKPRTKQKQPKKKRHKKKFGLSQKNSQIIFLKNCGVERFFKNLNIF